MNSARNGKYVNKYKNLYSPFLMYLKDTYLKQKIIAMYCGTYNKCRTEMYYNNKTKDRREVMEVYHFKVLIKYVK